MKGRRTIRTRRREAGIALLIAIFVLLLIGVVAIALIVSGGTETALAGNYRSSTSVYYAAVAGLEEARARLRSTNPNSFQKTASNFLPAPGTPLPVCSPVYVINPLGSENVAPWDSTNKYFDRQFSQEFSVACSGGSSLPPNPSSSTYSVWSALNSTSPLNALPFPGPLYKWVRINGVSEQSLNLDTFPYTDSSIDPGLLYYDGTNLTDVAGGNNPQVLELTALAVLPNGSSRLLQYLAAPPPLNLNLSPPPFNLNPPAALTLYGNSPQFTASPSSSFYVNGIDQGSAGTCNPSGTAYKAVGYTDSSYSLSNFVKPTNSAGISTNSPNQQGNYMNALDPNPNFCYLGGTTSQCPNPAPVTLSPNLSTAGGLNNFVNTIEQSADVVINGNACIGGSCAVQANLPAGMSASNPMTIVVNGDLTFSGWRNTGYGLLLVTGTLTYDPDASWYGIILVIGKGVMYSHQDSYTNTQIQGAVLIARTVDSSGNPLSAASAPSSPRFDFSSTPDDLRNGIYYSSCWIQAAMPAPPYKILSFHEISQ